MSSKEHIFDKDFFDSGEETEARYESYTIQSMLPKFQHEARLLIEHYRPSRVLDIGCAKGFLVLALKDLGIEAFGVDVSDYALSSAPNEVRQNLSKVDLNSDELPFTNESFDLVTVYSAFEYLDNLPHTFSEIRRVMRNGGILHTEIGYGAYYSKAGRYLVDKYGIKLRDESHWVQALERFSFEFLRTASERYYYDTFVEAQLKSGTGLKVGIGRMIARSKVGRSALVNYVKKRSKIGILCFRARKSNLP
jgi:ubiquinone/menaquinone biosynthesis C-methylase UbiE